MKHHRTLWGLFLENTMNHIERCASEYERKSCSPTCWVIKQIYASTWSKIICSKNIFSSHFWAVQPQTICTYSCKFGIITTVFFISRSSTHRTDKIKNCLLRELSWKEGMINEKKNSFRKERFESFTRMLSGKHD